MYEGKVLGASTVAAPGLIGLGVSKTIVLSLLLALFIGIAVFRTVYKLRNRTASK